MRWIILSCFIYNVIKRQQQQKENLIPFHVNALNGLCRIYHHIGLYAKGINVFNSRIRYSILFPFRFNPNNRHTHCRGLSFNVNARAFFPNWRWIEQFINPSGRFCPRLQFISFTEFISNFKSVYCNQKKMKIVVVSHSQYWPSLVLLFDLLELTVFYLYFNFLSSSLKIDLFITIRVPTTIR